jgi:hypothetical protein
MNSMKAINPINPTNSINAVRFFYLVLILLFAIPVSGYAQEGDQSEEVDCSIPKELKTPLKAPPEIKIGVFFVDVQTINDKQQTFSCNAIFQASWQDPRLSEQSLGKSLENCTISIDDIWHPDIVPMNFVKGETYRKLITVDKQGKAIHTQRIRNAQFFFDLEFRDFPFDAQVLHILLGTADEITLAVDREFTGIRQHLSIEGWDITLKDAVLTSEKIESYGSIARLDFQLLAKRHPGYYLWKVILPLCLIVLMAWSVFWIDPSQIGPQLGLSTATVFTLIAYRFTLSIFLPSVAYFTRMDIFVLLSTFLVFLALGLAITTSRLASKDRKELAMKIERTSKIIYLVIFAFIVIYSFVL